MNDSQNDEKAAKCAIRNAKTKSAKQKLIARIARLVRQAGLTYPDWRYVAKHVRRKCELRPAKQPKRLPRVLTAEQFRAFYRIVDQADDAQHGLMLRLLFYTGVRVGELSRIEVADVDLETCKIFVRQGKGSKDRCVLFGRSFAVALRAHIANHPTNRWLFQTRRATRFSVRRVQQITKAYAERAGIVASPHSFRHACLTWLTRHSGMADAELQLLSGHERAETLRVYQHVAVDGDLQQKYEQAMRKIDL